MRLCSCLASCLAWDIQHWSLLAVGWSWVLALRHRSLWELSPTDIMCGWDVSGGPMSWTRLSTSDAQAWHQGRAPRPCQPHGWIYIWRTRNRKNLFRTKSLTVGLLAGSLQHVIPYIISWWQVQSIALLWLASWSGFLSCHSPAHHSSRLEPEAMVKFWERLFPCSGRERGRVNTVK